MNHYEKIGDLREKIANKFVDSLSLEELQEIVFNDYLGFLCDEPNSELHVYAKDNGIIIDDDFNIIN